MQRSNLFVFGFAMGICIVVSVGLSLASTALSRDQAISARLEVLKNILLVAGHAQESVESMAANDPEQVIEMFRRQFAPLLVDRQNREIKPAFLQSELQKLGFPSGRLEQLEAFELIGLFNAKLSLLAERAGKQLEQYDPGINLIYLYRPKGETELYILPVEGSGLWDVIHGYVALERDLNTIHRIRFYKHAETPGLGGECSEPWFTGQFEGKKLLNQEGRFVSVAVVKGRATDLYTGKQLDHYVDGISGGTITGKGITQFLYDDLGRYNGYFASLRQAQQQISEQTKEQESGGQAKEQESGRQTGEQ